MFTVVFQLFSGNKILFIFYVSLMLFYLFTCIHPDILKIQHLHMTTICIQLPGNICSGQFCCCLFVLHINDVLCVPFLQLFVDMGQPPMYHIAVRTHGYFCRLFLQCSRSLACDSFVLVPQFQCVLYNLCCAHFLYTLCMFDLFFCTIFMSVYTIFPLLS